MKRKAFTILLLVLILVQNVNVTRAFAHQIVSDKKSHDDDLSIANKKFDKGIAKYKQFTGLYNDAVSHGNSDFLHNEKYILRLLDSSTYYCNAALKIYKSFEKHIDSANKKKLQFNISNTLKTISAIKVMQEKMHRFYTAPPGKSMRELTR